MIRVLGIDPGVAITGYGIIESAAPSQYKSIAYGCIRSSSRQPMTERLKHIYDAVAKLVKHNNPSTVALEDVFYGRNIQVALKLGQARGAAIIAALNSEKQVATFSPREVKLALTGYGAASKEQVQRMVQSTLQLEHEISPLDASDALAIAICYTNRWWTNKNMNIKV